MNIHDGYHECLDKWISGILPEIYYWDEYIGKKGAGGSHKWDDVISNTRPFRLEEDIVAPQTNFLDVGSGPFSRCGMVSQKTALSITAVDPLAHIYRRIKHQYGITTGLSPEFAMVEFLHEAFPGSSFDIVHMSNSLDHCFDPVTAIFTMLHVCRIGGKIILRHTKNEAERGKYSGFHQWNIIGENGRLIIWRPGIRIDIGETIKEFADVSVYEDVLEQPEKVWKYDKVVITKNKNAEIPQVDYNFTAKSKLMQALCDNILSDFYNKNANAQNVGEQQKQKNNVDSIISKKLFSISQKYDLLKGEHDKLVNMLEQSNFDKQMDTGRPIRVGENKKRYSAAKHAREWHRLYNHHQEMPRIDGIELTNICNLQCPNCPTPTTAYPQGYASKETVMTAFQYAQPGTPFSFHRLGEPFLHKDFLTYLEIAGQLGIHTVVSTNGTLLTDAKIKDLMACYPHSVMVSLHTKKSLESFIKLTEYCYSNDCFPINFQANLLSHNQDDVFSWIQDTGVDETVTHFIKQIQSHSWAGNVAHKKRVYSPTHTSTMVKRCSFIQRNHVNIRWDGTVVACCLDSENVTKLGHISDFPLVRQNHQGYTLCRYCDSDWMHG